MDPAAFFTHGTSGLTVTDIDGATNSTSASVSVSRTGGSRTTIASNDFESGWGSWNDGGTDCRHSANDSTYCIPCATIPTTPPP